jgi:hypothetical protein
MSAAQAIETGLPGIVVWSSAAICAPRRSAPAASLTTTGEPVDNAPWVPVPQVIVVV